MVVKVVVAPVAVVAGLLMAFPVLFAAGDPAPAAGCAPADEMSAILATIRARESGDDYTVQAAGSSASGAYQFTDATWNSHGGYARAWQAPADVQDQKATEHVQGILDAHDGDVSAVPVVWYIGHLPAESSAEWDTVPAPGAGNVLTPRQYQQHWLDEYDRQLAAGDDATSETEPLTSCMPGGRDGLVVGGYAYPGPADLFAAAPVDAPHHDYPSWDWGLPVGTPIYAVRGGLVISVQNWPHNWWDYGCGQGRTGCKPCGVGVTIEDDTGTRWGYCHASAVHVTTGDEVAVGANILTSGNTGRSSGPHLHLQIRTPDGALRCPQPLLRALRDEAGGLDPTVLPTSGCTY
jgi:hypothetical protein